MRNGNPDTIQTIIEQAGGRGINGAFAYVGAHNFRYSCSDGSRTVMDGEWRSKFTSHQIPPMPGMTGSGTVNYDVHLSFAVNGKSGYHWQMTIAYEPDDTYTVWLVARRGSRVDVLAEVRDVYCDDVQIVVESVYENTLKTTNVKFLRM